MVRVFQIIALCVVSVDRWLRYCTFRCQIYSICTESSRYVESFHCIYHVFVLAYMILSRWWKEHDSVINKGTIRLKVRFYVFVSKQLLYPRRFTIF